MLDMFHVVHGVAANMAQQKMLYCSLLQGAMQTPGALARLGN
jgi:hypothetical protein